MAITMDNSFDGTVHKQGDRLLPRKRADFGTGTDSITAVAKKHSGGTNFGAEGLAFQSSVCVRV